MKIEISEGCYGPDVSIDNNSLFKGEYDSRSDEEVSNLQETLLKEISQIKGSLDMRDWMEIANILVSRGRFVPKGEDYYQSTCDQCGNYNYSETFQKVKDDE